MHSSFLFKYHVRHSKLGNRYGQSTLHFRIKMYKISPKAPSSSTTTMSGPLHFDMGQVQVTWIVMKSNYIVEKRKSLGLQIDSDLQENITPITRY